MAKRKKIGLFGADRVCAVVAVPTAAQAAAAIRGAGRAAGTIELRLDYLQTAREASRLAGWLSRQRKRVTLLATCRRRSAGGRFAGSPRAQIARLAAFVRGGCQWCDVEPQTIQALGLREVCEALQGARLLVSHHDFRRTLHNLSGILRRLERCGGDAAKIATQCNSYADSVRVLALARGRRNVVAVPMGEVGLPARILALKHGSALAYASVGQATAPGQVSLDEMKNLYRADRLDRRSRVYGVIGNPVSHSLSPLMHNLGFAARGMNDVYLPFLVRDLRDFLRAVRPLGVAGFSVTLPHKQAILQHLDDCDPLAAAIGAVNTVVVRGGGRLYGYNTDYVGVLRALARRIPLRGARVLLLGAGGAARAVAFALAQEGAVVGVCARRSARARQLARAVGGEVVARPRLRQEFFDAIVNCTPVGMHPQTERSPLEARELNCRLVFDLVYRPMKTRLLALAARRGIETVSGVEMFVAQGTAQWEIWTGLRAPEAIMRRVVLGALKKEAGKSSESR